MTDGVDIESRCQAPAPIDVAARPAVTLANTDVGRGARVRDVCGDDAVSVRLLEMGLTPGTAVRVVAEAPLGDPIELEVRGYRLSIRRAEAARVVVAID